MAERLCGGWSRREFVARGVGAAVALALGEGAAAGTEAGAQAGTEAGSPVAGAEADAIARPIPSSGERLPVIGLGTNAYGVSDPAEYAARREVLERLPALGGKVVDTARAYGDSELVIGRALAELGNRASLFLASKTPIGGDVSGGRAVVEESFRRLQVEVIDLMQIHNLHGLETLMPVLVEMKAEKKIRYVGMSTSSDAQYAAFLAALSRHPVDFLQVDYSIGNRSAAERILPFAQEKGIAVLVNMPFGGRRSGNLFPQVRGRALPAWAAEADIGSWAQFFLKYVVSHPAVTCAIPGTTQASHLADNQGAGRGRLPDAAMRRRMEAYWDAG
jgi:aryl-alcohol dehydrogenase-like predicted oxidoreductase